MIAFPWWIAAVVVWFFVLLVWHGSKRAVTWVLSFLCNLPLWIVLWTGIKVTWHLADSNWQTAAIFLGLTFLAAFGEGINRAGYKEK